jgi:hypothetical protein
MSDTGVTLKTRLLSTVRLLCTNLNMLMLVPFSLYTGMEQVVIYAEFTNVSIRMPTSMIDPQDLFSHLHSELKTNLLCLIYWLKMRTKAQIQIQDIHRVRYVCTRETIVFRFIQ